MMEQTDWSQFEDIRREAWEAHRAVNQRYDGVHPYGMHLDMVASRVLSHAREVLADPADLPALMMGAFWHDAIEDARLTYNDVHARALGLMGGDRRLALMAAEIVYALTNDKGRTRAQRAGDRYYAGIRATPYAPMVKLADRLANATYSRQAGADAPNRSMAAVYARETPHFLESLRVPEAVAAADRRLGLPPQMVAELLAVTGPQRPPWPGGSAQ